MLCELYVFNWLLWLTTRESPRLSKWLVFILFIFLTSIRCSPSKTKTLKWVDEICWFLWFWWHLQHTKNCSFLSIYQLHWFQLNFFLSFVQIHRRRHEHLSIDGCTTECIKFCTILSSGSRISSIGCIGRCCWCWRWLFGWEKFIYLHIFNQFRLRNNSDFLLF